MLLFYKQDRCHASSGHASGRDPRCVWVRERLLYVVFTLSNMPAQEEKELYMQRSEHVVSVYLFYLLATFGLIR